MENEMDNLRLIGPEWGSGIILLTETLSPEQLEIMKTKRR